MRWTSPIRLVFLMPAVLWVLAFTIVPLVYSLYAAFHNVTNETVVTRTRSRASTRTASRSSSRTARRG